MAPVIISDPSQMLALVEDQKRLGKRIGLIPTMGALHAGHLSLVERATKNTDFTVVTIFVNPTQFGPNEDLDKYPRNLQQDTRLLSAYNVDVIFTPTVETMYPAGASTRVVPPAVASPFEGRLRPKHFEGVATIVLKLFHLIPADIAFFGQKDYQQTRVIGQMIEDLDIPIQVQVCPIIREDDGLALSSRNAYLSDAERRQAVALSQALFCLQKMVEDGERNSNTLLEKAKQALADASIGQIDYVALVDKHDLSPVQQVDSNTIAIAAVYVGETRLIDNVFLS